MTTLTHRLMSCISALVLSAPLLAFPAVAADAWPSRPVTIINPWAAGGPAEAIIRPIAEKLGQRLGEPFVVDSRGGANGTIGAAAVARAQPDGYTLLFSHVGPIAISPALPNKPSYDSVKDFAPITQIVSGPTVLVVRSDFPVRSLAELIAYAKAHPGQVAYGSVGIGSSTHMAGATLAQMSGTQMIHVPYRGSSMINTDLLGGQIQTAFVNVAGVVGLIKDGKLRPIAVSTTKRTSALPDVPTVAESYPGFEVNSWYGLMAPAKTPPAIIARLHAEIVEILKMPDIQQRLKDNGLDAEGTTPDAYGAKIKSDLVRWAAAVKAADIKE
ncbi:tripartite tricarboxylate transporter substrate binding protein [Variovorax sp. J22P271]|uniref:Bug family tripartite tricarboxylate transporter substrate binding protein n=1 Tax=Variovorax davisae TaxID=3053515 RepID=UPI0025762B18|nr:tripartite tricarboxylate transporter substrate binding protein [Variovorax sp. J22P271]MDM0032463.1 tripartite tricarboxylate transporter substrate binding protein [Variovorax sp. J22P271]